MTTKEFGHLTPEEIELWNTKLTIDLERLKLDAQIHMNKMSMINYKLNETEEEKEKRILDMKKNGDFEFEINDPVKLRTWIWPWVTRPIGIVVSREVTQNVNMFGVFLTEYYEIKFHHSLTVTKEPVQWWIREKRLVLDKERILTQKITGETT